jgi:hypothetical protein
MNNHARLEEPNPGRLDQRRVTELLARYPDVSVDEARAILNFLRTGRHFDVGLLITNSRLKPNLDAFLKDHRSHFEVEPGRAEAVVGIVVLFLFVLWAFWAVLN